MAVNKISATKPKRKKNKPPHHSKKTSIQSRLSLVTTGVILATLICLIASVLYIASLDRKLVDRFEGKIWKLPAKVYARPLELYLGKAISPSQLKHELHALNYSSVNKLPEEQGQYHEWQSSYEIKTRDFEYWDGAESSMLVRVEITNNEITLLYDIFKNENVSLLRFDPVYIAGIFPSHGQDRELIKFDEIPSLFLKTLILIEDRRFFDHFGVDLRAIGRALLANLKAGKTVQGGSTITQQLIKNLFLSSDQSLIRKINEAIMAVLLELHYDKKTILETYINEIFLGQDRQRAIHGFGLASQFYFGTELKNLSADKMTALVAMVKGASYYNPKNHPLRSKQRRDTILHVMSEHRLLTADQARLLSTKPLLVKEYVKRKPYPAFMDIVKRQLRENYMPDDLKSEGLRIFTTLDPYVQHVSEQAVLTVMPKIDRYAHSLQSAGIVISPGSGDILSMVGDRKPSFDGFNRVLDAYRPIGSLVKPVVYLTALQDSKKFTLSSMISDQPLSFKGDDNKIWEPQNYDNEFLGDILLFDAFIQSRNIPAVRVGLDTGLKQITDTIKSLGFKRRLNGYPSMTLGAIEMSPYEVASLYQVFASNGFSNPLNSVMAVQNNQGELLQRYPIEVQKAADSNTLFLVNYALQKVAEKGTAKALKNP